MKPEAASASVEKPEKEEKPNRADLLPPIMACIAANAPLTVSDVATFLDVDRRTVTRMLIDGSLPGFCVRSGRCQKVWRVRPEALQRWIASKEREGQRAARESSRNGKGAVIEHVAE